MPPRDSLDYPAPITTKKPAFESDRYRNYLTTMSRFHRYSLNNVMLIHAQKPDATLVAGFNKWKNSFGRHVKKGEKGIQILAPTPYKIKQEEQKLDPDTKLPLLDENGEPVTEEKEVTIPMFKVVSVFDVSQTDGRPLPQISSTLTGDVAEYEVFLEALHRTSPVPISFQAMEPGMDGYFAPKKQKIFLREGMSQVQTICAAVHEIAHSKLHDYEHLTELADDGKTMSIYNPGTRLGLIQALNEMRTYLAEDEQELRTLTDSAVYKLSRITDNAFEKLDLIPEF